MYVRTKTLKTIRVPKVFQVFQALRPFDIEYRRPGEFESSTNMENHNTIGKRIVSWFV